MTDLDYIALVRMDAQRRMNNRHTNHVGRALVWAVIVFLALTVIFTLTHI